MLSFKLFIALIYAWILVYDIYSLYKSKRQIREYKFRISSWLTPFSIVSIVLVVVFAIFLLVEYLTFNEGMFLLNVYIFLIIAIQYSFHVSNKDYICDVGVLFWGRLYKWNEISSYCWANGGRYLIFKVKNKFLGIENELKFRINEELKDEISGYLSIQINDIKL
jgi:predicted CDP-diglyceride synthetase/phosphatidate cytidylyltransferase